VNINQNYLLMASKHRRVRKEGTKSKFIAAAAWIAALVSIVRWLFVQLARKAMRA
jgi:hypothetical protein